MTVTKNISSSLLTQIPVFFLSVVTGVFITRMLGAEGKGIYSLFQADLQFFVLLLTFMMSTGIIYFISTAKMEASNLLGIVLATIGLGTVLLILFFVVLYCTDKTGFFFNKSYENIFYYGYLILSFVITALNASFTALFQGNAYFSIINRMLLLNALVQLILFGSLFWWHESNMTHISIQTVLLLTFSVLVFNFVFWMYLFKKHLRIVPKFKWKKNHDARIFYSYIFIIYIGTLINFMNYRLDLWFVNYYLTDRELGEYSLAGNIAQLFITVSLVISSVLLPFLAKSSDPKSSFGVFVLCAKMNFFIILIGVVFMFFTADFLIPMIYGQEFEGAISPLLIILPGVLMSCSTQLFATLIVARNRNLLNILATSAGLVITLILDFLLIPQFGLYGAATATVVSYSIIFIFTFLLCINRLEIPLGNYFIPSISELKSLRSKIKFPFYNKSNK